MTYYDDNYGHYDGEDSYELRRFAKRVAQRSVDKTCVICGRKVRILPEYDKCDPCTRRIESGFGEY